MGSAEKSRCSFKTSMRKTINTSIFLELLVLSVILLTPFAESLSTRDIRLVRRERSVTGRSISFWGAWGPWSGCSRSCGGGVASQVRPCLRRRRSGTIGVGHHCVGLYRQYKQCNTKPCSYGSKDFRTEQCETYNNIPFMGKFYDWYAFVKEPMVCELNCRATGYRFYAKHADKVVDGTVCRPGSTDVCVNGMCKVGTIKDYCGCGLLLMLVKSIAY
ncbi:thrombospondin type-1 domain-containing protein 4-like [Anneissia japonica]|uniref:thrombospondin type-1 domain-containing protein 4-like n=1 Tax=Anneissia japonica TaxID=1529436 RepID=UPI0014256314|nr:thrombospondin type-1 domain-containing protein 4-like [Anneissia japonica]